MGVRWLSRRCSIVFYEFATPADENPDVIGWATGSGSVMIECKLTRSDFLRDAAKTVRRNARAGGGDHPEDMAAVGQRRRVDDADGGAQRR